VSVASFGFRRNDWTRRLLTTAPLGSRDGRPVSSRETPARCSRVALAASLSPRYDLPDLTIPGTRAQYPGLQGGGALGDASTPGTPAGSIAASAHGGTYSHVAVAGETWGGERGTAAATAAAAARRRRATPTGRAVTLPRSAPAQGGRGDRHGARAGGWDRPPRDGAPLIAPLDGVRNRRRAAATQAGAQVRSPAGHRGRVTPRKSLRAVAARNSGRRGGAGGQAPSGPCDPCGRAVLLGHITLFAFSVIATLPTLTRPQIPEDTNVDCHL